MNELAPTLNKDMASIEASNEVIDYLHDERFKRIGRVAPSHISALAQCAPSAAAAKTMSETFKVVYPEGVRGTLVPHGPGYLSVMRSEDSPGFVAHATFVPVGPEAVAMGAFAAMSAVTGQYYLHHINQELTSIRAKLDQVLDFLYDEKACELYAVVQEVSAIYANYAYIIDHAEQLAASIQTIQHAKIIAEKNVQFYSRDMNRTINTMDPKKINEHSIGSLKDDLDNYRQSVNLYGVCSILEIFLSENFENAYLEYIRNDLKAHMDAHTRSMSKLEGMLAQLNQLAAPKGGVLDKLSAPKTDKLEQFISDIQQLGEKSAINDFESVMSQIIGTYTKPTEFHVLKNGTVYQKVKELA